LSDRINRFPQFFLVFHRAILVALRPLWVYVYPIQIDHWVPSKGVCGMASGASQNAPLPETALWRLNSADCPHVLPQGRRDRDISAPFERRCMEPLPYYKWYWQKFRSSRCVQRMGYVARGLYRELLDEQWDKGGIPNSIEALANICDCPAEIMALEWPKIAPCFAVKKGKFLLNGTLESYRTETDTKRKNLQMSGRAGAVSKINKINADLANAEQLLSKCQANAKQMPYRRVDKSIEEQSSGNTKSSGNTNIPFSPRENLSEAKSKKVKHSADPRHIACKAEIFAYYQKHNENSDPDWEGREGRALGMFLAANPKISEAGLVKLLNHRSRSEVNHSERPAKWISTLTSYRNGPLDKFGKPKGNGNGSSRNTTIQARDEYLAELEEENRRSLEPNGDDAIGKDGEGRLALLH